MTFWLIAASIGVCLLAFGFWRGRKWEAASRRNRHGGMLPNLTYSPHPRDWEWPPPPPLGLSIHEGPHPLYDRIHNPTTDPKETHAPDDPGRPARTHVRGSERLSLVLRNDNGPAGAHPQWPGH